MNAMNETSIIILILSQIFYAILIQLEYSEELADVIKPVNLLTALSIYLTVNAPQKVNF